MDVTDHHAILFREEQQFRQLWIWLLVGGIVAIGWWGFIQQILFGIPFGDNPAPDLVVWLIWLIFGIGLPLFFYNFKLVVEVGGDAIRINPFPLSIFRRTIPIEQIKHYEARTYSPLAEYGGWGIRSVPGKGWLYNVSGNLGVQLELTNGKRILIGSQRPEELAQALDAAHRRLEETG